METITIYLVLVLFTILYLALALYIRPKLQIPKLIQKIEDKKERMEKFSFYISDVITWAHAPPVLLIAGYILYKKPITYGEENSSDEELLLLVNKINYFFFNLTIIYYFSSHQHILCTTQSLVGFSITMIACFSSITWLLLGTYFQSASGIHLNLTNKQSGIGSRETLWGLFMAELSNPIMSFHNYFENHQINLHLLLPFKGVFMVAFIYLRTGPCTQLILGYQKNDDISWISKISSTWIRNFKIYFF